MDQATMSELLAEASRLSDDDDAWTWIDNDPDVAWGDPDSYHGRLAALYEDAGWERCYHRDRARFHYNVKVETWTAFQGFEDAAERLTVETGRAYTPEVLESYFRDATDFDLESFWYVDLPDFIRFDLDQRGAKAWACGRSGGYVNCPDLESDPEAMIRLTEYLSREAAYRRSRDWGFDLADQVWDALADNDESFSVFAERGI